jgi:hypothetical protein
MDDLVAFLNARLDEDEAVRLRLGQYDRHEGTSELDIVEDYLTISGERALREVEAKRRRLARHRPHLIEGRDGDGIERAEWFCLHCEDPWPCPDVRDDATVWSDHPAYQLEWTPK